MRVLISIGGASGSIYGVQLLEELNKSGVETHLIISSTARKILDYETGFTPTKVKKLAQFFYENDDFLATPASGSFQLDAMVIIPCTIKTLSAIANGYADTLTARAALCCLKEGKPLIIVLRETPLDTASINNMLTAKRNGAIILPASPGFYHKPTTIGDLVDFIVGKTLDQLNISHSLFQRWQKN
jgi:4-hydroxy-3-polyprenylbenzoate decarboxylase